MFHNLLSAIIIFWSVNTYANQHNIILILSDDQSWAGLSVKMDPSIKLSRSLYDHTPNLEILSKQGVIFSNAYAPSPVCSPTRISIQTGKTPARLNWTKAEPFYNESDKFYLIPPKHEKNIKGNELTIGEALRAKNYYTAHFGKWHLSGGGPVNHGYIYSDGDIGNKYASKYKDPNPVDLFGMRDRAKLFLEKSKKDGRNFFMQLSFHALHYPQNALKKTKAKYKEKFKDIKNTKLINRIALNENMDTAIGEVLDHLRFLDLEKNTYIIFMSDNGAGGRNGILKGGKGSLFEGGIRVPFIIKGPNIPKNQINKTPIIGYDLMPTFMKIAGYQNIPENIDGTNILEIFDKNFKSLNRNTTGLIFHFPHYQGEYNPQSAIIKDSWKLIKYYDGKQPSLFNLNLDINEEINLFNNKPTLGNSLINELENYLEQVNASFPIINPNYDKNAKINMKNKNRKNKTLFLSN